MASFPFKESKDYTLGLELEFQIINPKTYNLISKAIDLLRAVRSTNYAALIKPEITQSMLELNTSVHSSTQSVWQELQEIQAYLLNLSQEFDILFCGGGTHPFQKWVSRKIFPTSRFRQISRKYRYLAKRSTVFGLHVHVGCSDGDKAIYLAHILHRYVPQLLALSASSPFYEGVDTGFDSCRITIFNNFPLSGTMPYVADWKSFTDYFNKLKDLKIAESMKDFYWDIRPKPEFGTVEIRVCDTPLSFHTAVRIAAYIQSLACYILTEKPFKLTEDIYTFHNYNRFQAARHGLDGKIVDPFKREPIVILQDFNETLKTIEPYAEKLANSKFLEDLKQHINSEKNDTHALREKYAETTDLKAVVNFQCEQWKL